MSGVLPWHFHYEADDNSVYSLEEIVYMSDSDDDIEEVVAVGTFENPVDLTGSDTEDETDEECMSDDEDELYLE